MGGEQPEWPQDVVAIHLMRRPNMQNLISAITLHHMRLFIRFMGSFDLHVTLIMKFGL